MFILCVYILEKVINFLLAFNSKCFVSFRLREISEESVMPPSQPRRRSNSLPIPQIEISLYQGSGNSRDSPSNSSLTTKDYIEIPDQPVQVVNDPPLQSQKSFDKTDETHSTNGARRPSKKKVKMADLRTLIETKILSKSDRGLEKIGESGGSSNGKRLQHAVILFFLFCSIAFNKTLVIFYPSGSASQSRHRRRTSVSFNFKSLAG